MDAMLRGMSSRQFLEWQTFAELEPFDESRADVRAGAIIAGMYELRRDHAKRATPFTARDFALRFGDEPDRRPEPETPDASTRSWQEMKFMAQMIVAASPR